MGLKEKLVFWKDYFPTKSVVMRRRGDDWIPEVTNAVRMIYDNAPNAHELETGEETKAAPLESVYQCQDNSEGEPDVAIYEFPKKNKAVVGRIIDLDKNKGAVEPEMTTEGKPILFFMEPEDGQLIPWKFNMEREEFEPELIENKDERLNFYLDHLEKSFDKYMPEGWLAKIAEHKEMLITVALFVGLSMLLYVYGQQFGDAIPYLKEISNQMPGLKDAIMGIGPEGPPGQ